MRKQAFRRQIDLRLIIGTALLGLILPGCGRSGPPPLIQGHADQPCTVFFRRDALGMATDLPASAQTNNTNGAKLSIEGVFLRSTPAELILRVDGKETIIPREVILMTQLTAQK